MLCMGFFCYILSSRGPGVTEITLTFSVSFLAWFNLTSPGLMPTCCFAPCPWPGYFAILASHNINAPFDWKKSKQKDRGCGLYFCSFTSPVICSWCYYGAGPSNISISTAWGLPLSNWRSRISVLFFPVLPFQGHLAFRSHVCNDGLLK